ncbi:MAG: glutamate racemase [Desulfobacteraceae bacterium]|nr:MAG: glutamate racemase [Desulfobacteraceae bacterium]
MIGVFDSGVGGMTVARAIERALPGRQLIYFGDLARTPYGNKSADAILEYSVQNTQFLIDHGATVVVVACNSASSVAPEYLRQRFSLPIIEVIRPAIELALAEPKTKRIGIIGTTATIRSGIYEQQLKQLAPDVEVYSQACPLLVPLVEEGWTRRQETKMIVRRYLQPLRQRAIDTLVLGCTHYPLLKHIIQPRIGRRVRIIDSSEAVAKTLASVALPDYSLAAPASGERNRFFVSDWTPAAAKTAQGIFGRPVELVKV